MPVFRSQIQSQAGLSLAVINVSSSGTIPTTNCFLFCNASSSGFTLTLPAASTSKGTVVYLKKTDSSSHAITVSVSGSDTIDGASSLSIATQYAVYSFVSNGTGWSIVSGGTGVPNLQQVTNVGSTTTNDVQARSLLLTDGSGGTITGYDTNHGMTFRVGGSNITRIFEYGGTYSSGAGIFFRSGGTTDQIQVANDQVGINVPIVMNDAATVDGRITANGGVDMASNLITSIGGTTTDFSEIGWSGDIGYATDTGSYGTIQVRYGLIIGISGSGSGISGSGSGIGGSGSVISGGSGVGSGTGSRVGAKEKAKVFAAKKPAAIKKYRNAFYKVKTPGYPGGEGRGIVICGGGRLFASAYVTISILRKVGCKLPIQLWYLGKREPKESWMIDVLKDLDVEWVDADAIDTTTKKLNGWELKSFALLNTKFREVLEIDADCYPISNPEYLFDDKMYQMYGSLFFPDQQPEDIAEIAKAWEVPDIRELLGLPVIDERGIEAGVMLIDRQECWESLYLTWWINDNSEFFYKYMHGDKDTFNLAWRRYGKTYGMTPGRWKWNNPAIIHHDNNNVDIFIHRARSKFFLLNADRTKAGFCTPQDGKTVNFQLPHEDECQRLVLDLTRVYQQFLMEKEKV
jgi:hypothetical protein